MSDDESELRQFAKTIPLPYPDNNGNFVGELSGHCYCISPTLNAQNGGEPLLPLIMYDRKVICPDEPSSQPTTANDSFEGKRKHLLQSDPSQKNIRNYVCSLNFR